MLSRRISAAAGVLLLLAGSASAQTIYADSESDFRGRASVELEKKIAHGLHVSLNEEARFKDNLSSFDKLYSTVDMSWKFCPWMKVSGAYSFIYKDEACRQRVSLAATGYAKYGDWRFNLREKVQMTNNMKEGLNTYQQPRNAVELRSRLQASYKVRTIPLQPYAFCELSNPLNGSKYETTDASTQSYTDVYLRRVRLALGTEYHINNSNILDVYAMYDFVHDKELDATKAGVLKTITITPKNLITIGVAYKFKL